MPDGIFFFALSGICFMADKNFLRNLRKGVDNVVTMWYNVLRKVKEALRKTKKE